MKRFLLLIKSKTADQKNSCIADSDFFCIGDHTYH